MGSGGTVELLPYLLITGGTLLPPIAFGTFLIVCLFRYAAMRKFYRFRRAVVAIQLRFRVRAAQRILTRLKKDAKSLAAVSAHFVHPSHSDAV